MTQNIAQLLEKLKKKEYTRKRRHVDDTCYIQDDTTDNFLLMFKTALSHEKPILHENDLFGFHLSTDHRQHALGGFCGNLTPNYGKALQLGFNGLRQEIHESMAASRDPNAIHYGGQMLQCMDLVAGYADEYRLYAIEQGNKLLASALSNVPCKPAGSMYEACVFLNLIIYFLRLTNVEHLTLGRFDQYMYSYYQTDRAKGISNEQIQELIEAFFIALNYDTDLYKGIQVGDNGQSMVLGGYDQNGNSQYNELTQMCIAASAELCLIDPKINLRVSRKTTDEIFEFATQLTKKGLGFPQYCNDDVIIPAMIKLGYAPEDAANYSVAACWEVIVPGKGAELVNIAALHYPCVVHHVLQNKLKDCTTFDQLMDEVDCEIEKECNIIISHFYGRRIDEPNAFHPLLSVFMDGCTKKLQDACWGGVTYYNYGCHAPGLANGADALAAIKKTIYDDKTLHADELLIALENNFEGYSAIRRQLLNCPKMGNNDDYVDNIAGMLMSSFSRHLNGKPNGFGGVWRAGTGSADLYIHSPTDFATADGRLANTPYSCSFSPSLDVRTDGVLSVIQSFTKHDLSGLINGGPLTLEMHDSVFRNEIGIRKVAHLAKAFVQLGGHQLQLNAVNRERLLDAQKNPQSYPNLIVRVWGWSGYFNELDKPFQDHIIRRTEYAG